MSVKQTTISEPIEITGVGLHSGQMVKARFVPAEAGHGYKFKRVDMEGTPLIKADCDLVVDTSRSTTLEFNGARVSTIEHALAALTGMEIDNVLIEINGQELPILDGSAFPFLELLKRAGKKELDAERHYFILHDTLHYRDPDGKTELTALPYPDGYALSVMIDFKSKVLGRQHAGIENLSEFEDEIAPARTFCFLHEIEPLLKANLIKGGSLQNAIVLVEKPITKEELTKLAGALEHPELEVLEAGVLNNTSLHFPNEPARHKLLDVMGDLALIGIPLKARIVAQRPGHKANIAFARQLKKHIKQTKFLGETPSYFADSTPLYDVPRIQKRLPHRYPFLLIDKIIELSDKVVVGVKNVTFNEHFFQGHFPGNPVMPGVLQLEALAQTGGILVMNTVPDPENYDTYFLKIDNARFKHKVVPGDTLLLKMELLSPIRRGLCEMKATAYVGSKVVTEAYMLAQIVKTRNEN